MSSIASSVNIFGSNIHWCGEREMIGDMRKRAVVDEGVARMVEELVAERLAGIEARILETIKGLLPPPANPSTENNGSGGSEPSNHTHEDWGKQHKGSRWSEPRDHHGHIDHNRPRRYAPEGRSRFQKARNKVVDLDNSNKDFAASPFCDNLLVDPTLENFHALHFDHYNGEGEPEEHIICFESAFPVWDISSSFKAKLLFSTFRGPTLKWFTHLPPGSIPSYSSFKKMFVRRFTNSKIRMKDP